MYYEESSRRVKIIDRKIDKFANYLQRRNNLNRIQFLKVRLGMQVVASNIEKTIVVYGLTLVFHTLIYTLISHLSYFIIRSNAHGAHAKSSLMCHIQNIIFFIIFPVLIIKSSIPYWFLLLLALFGFLFICKYAPAATRKQPIPKRLINRKRILSIIFYSIFTVISLVTLEPINKLILFGITLESVTLLPIFFPKEDI